MPTSSQRHLGRVPAGEPRSPAKDPSLNKPSILARGCPTRDSQVAARLSRTTPRLLRCVGVPAALWSCCALLLLGAPAAIAGAPRGRGLPWGGADSSGPCGNAAAESSRLLSPPLGGERAGVGVPGAGRGPRDDLQLLQAVPPAFLTSAHGESRGLHVAGSEWASSSTSSFRPNSSSAHLPSSSQPRSSASHPPSSPPSLSGSSPSSTPWAGAFRLSNCSESEYRALVQPLAQMAANAYRFPKILPLEGWVLSKRVLPLTGPIGAHALVYEEVDQESAGGNSSDPRVVVAFRGTQVSFPPDMSSVSDICADALLFAEAYSQGVPFFCSLFPLARIDYYTQAVDFVQLVGSAYGFRNQILLTGHSLGGALAIMASARLHPWVTVPVVSFAAGGVRVALIRRNVSVPPNDAPWLHDIMDMWDVFFQKHPTNHIGNLCLYSPPQPTACKCCYGPRAPSAWHNQSGSRTELETGRVNNQSGSRSELKTSSLHNRSGSPAELQTSRPSDGGPVTRWLEALWSVMLRMAEASSVWELTGYFAAVTSFSCAQCFYASHYFQHILNLIDDYPRPRCQPAPAPLNYF